MVRLINKKILSIIGGHGIRYPTPSNLNYFWGFGSISGFLLGWHLLVSILIGVLIFGCTLETPVLEESNLLPAQITEVVQIEAVVEISSNRSWVDSLIKWTAYGIGAYGFLQMVPATIVIGWSGVIWINHEVITAVIPIIPVLPTVLPNVLPNVLPLMVPVMVSQVILPELVIPVVAVADPLIATFTLHILKFRFWEGFLGHTALNWDLWTNGDFNSRGFAGFELTFVGLTECFVFCRLNPWLFLIPSIRSLFTALDEVLVNFWPEAMARGRDPVINANAMWEYARTLAWLAAVLTHWLHIDRFDGLDKWMWFL